jgi:hypothetical protein
VRELSPEVQEPAPAVKVLYLTRRRAPRREATGTSPSPRSGRASRTSGRARAAAVRRRRCLQGLVPHETPCTSPRSHGHLAEPAQRASLPYFRASAGGGGSTPALAACKVLYLTRRRAPRREATGTSTSPRSGRAPRTSERAPAPPIRRRRSLPARSCTSREGRAPRREAGTSTSPVEAREPPVLQRGRRRHLEGAARFRLSFFHCSAMRS